MELLDKSQAEALLARQGVGPVDQLARVLSGYDLDKPMYRMDFWPGDLLYQFIRKPSATEPDPALGNWFGLAGITLDSAAINSGLAGRHLARFKVISPFSALEGSAVRFGGHVEAAIGGSGGATQVYIPRSLLGCLESLGPA